MRKNFACGARRANKGIKPLILYIKARRRRENFGIFGPPGGAGPPWNSRKIAGPPWRPPLEKSALKTLRVITMTTILLKNTVGRCQKRGWFS